VDILTGVLGGAAFGPNIIGLFSTEAPSDLGQAFIVIDADAFGERAAFEARLERYFDQLASANTVPEAPGRVLIPGEPEAEAERRTAASGIRIDERHRAGLASLGERLGVAFPASANG
jgi:LDH2 family malate/lactate/ureidoglycolate dehydrogenase